MKKLCLIFALLLTLTMTGCGTTKDSTMSNNAAPKDSTVSNGAPDNVSTTGNVLFDLTKATYADQNVKINYPQISNLSVNGMQQKINELIKTSALEVLNDYKGSLSSLSLTMDYEIKYKGADLLSIIYLGLANVKNAAHPVNVIQTTSIDLEKGKQLAMSGVVTVNNGFVEKIKAGKYKAYSSDLNLEAAGVLKNVLSGFSSQDLLNSVKQQTAKFYFTKDSLGISIDVAHVLGDHMEMEMEYKSLGGLLLVKSQGLADNIGSTSDVSTGGIPAVASNSQSNSVITQEKAASIITDYLLKKGSSKDKDPNLVIALDRTDNVQGKEYFVFHIFDNMSDHTSTIGWYGVQKHDGSLYDFIMMKPII